MPKLQDLNSIAFSDITIDDQGDLTVNFRMQGLPQDLHFDVELTTSRTFDLYRDPELRRQCQKLYATLQERLQKPAPERVLTECATCQTCHCCRDYNVLVTEADVKRLAPRQELAAFKKEYTQPAQDWTGVYRTMLKQDRDDIGEKCIFLKPTSSGQMRCSVYARRPAICRAFTIAECSLWEGAPER